MKCDKQNKKYVIWYLCTTLSLVSNMIVENSSNESMFEHFLNRKRSLFDIVDFDAWVSRCWCDPELGN